MTSHISQIIKQEQLFPILHFQKQQLHFFAENIVTMANDVKSLLKLGCQIMEKPEDYANTGSKLSRETRTKIAQLEDINEESIIKLLATQRPLETDFRLLVISLKINNDIHRMSNQAGNIVDGFLRLRQLPSEDFKASYYKMIEAVNTMINDTMSAYTNIDKTLAEKVMKRDDKVDSLNLSLIRQLIELAEQYPEEADACIKQVLIIRNLERIGDFCNNIADQVVSYSKGCMIS
ncbi:hypothetical protein GX645_04785 [Candidatus Sumerlaeota bacterium]|nr:hypothetical protein [Candidatus Sumerlaeota bacterium]